MDQKQQVHCITITIVGALDIPFEGGQLHDLMDRVKLAIDEVFPDFLPGNPPVTIVTSELRDDWFGKKSKEAR